jgi:hypothetical protein
MVYEIRRKSSEHELHGRGWQIGIAATASRPFVRRHLVPSVIYRCHATPETSVSEEQKWARNVRAIYAIICDFHGKL